MAKPINGAPMKAMKRVAPLDDFEKSELASALDCAIPDRHRYVLIVFPPAGTPGDYAIEQFHSACNERVIATMRHVLSELESEQ